MNIINVYDIYGRIILKKEIFGNKNETLKVSLNEKTNGLYLVKRNDEVCKIVKVY